MQAFHVLAPLVALLLVAYSNASLVKLVVNEGDSVPVQFPGAKAIGRIVETGQQFFHFDGPNKGRFVTKEKKVIESDNYSIQNGTILLIKKFGKADVGSYTSEPNVFIEKVGNYSMAVAGPTLHITIKKKN
uniref:Uncharacterized protein n=1 Tax=Caenorhabditis japonica TaxID=281687 RepID=A0A8R1DRV4_CAEJA